MIGDLIRAELKKKGMTQVELAEKIGKSKITISQLVAGKFGPSANTLAKIGKVLDIELGYIIREDNYLITAIGMTEIIEGKNILDAINNFYVHFGFLRIIKIESIDEV